jgi:hypothetical protein
MVAKPATLKSIQGSLREDEALLEYVLAEPQAFCIAISRENAKITPLPSGRKTIEQIADEYLTKIRAQQPYLSRIGPARCLKFKRT